MMLTYLFHYLSLSEWKFSNRFPLQIVVYLQVFVLMQFDPGMEYRPDPHGGMMRRPNPVGGHTPQVK